jgi:hypothetical protein
MRPQHRHSLPTYHGNQPCRDRRNLYDKHLSIRQVRAYGRDWRRNSVEGQSG